MQNDPPSSVILLQRKLNWASIVANTGKSTIDIISMAIVLVILFGRKDFRK